MKKQKRTRLQMEPEMGLPLPYNFDCELGIRGPEEVGVGDELKTGFVHQSRYKWERIGKHEKICSCLPYMPLFIYVCIDRQSPVKPPDIKTL